MTALPLAGIEAKVGDELLGTGEAVDVADDGEEGEGVDEADAKDFHEPEHEGFLTDLDGDEAAQGVAPGFLGADLEEVIG